MHKIKLVPDAPYPAKCDITVFDVTDGKEKKRCRIAVEYGEDDVASLKKEGKDLQGAMQYYRDWLYQTVKTLIADEWEAVSGEQEILTIVKEQIQDAFA